MRTRALCLIVVLSIPVPAIAAGLGPDSVPRGRGAEAREARAALAVRSSAKPPTTVDCDKRGSLQEAVDKSESGAVIEVRGICVENVRVTRKDLLLRGVDPAADGVRGPVAGAASLRVRAGTVVVENLSFSGGAGSGISAEDALVFCEGCDLIGNAGFAALAFRGAAVSLLASTVQGRQGIRASLGSYADVDCINTTSTHPCALQATGIALSAINEATAAALGTGPFTGAVQSLVRSSVDLYGASQTSAGAPGSGPPRNLVDFFSNLSVEPAWETGQAARLIDTNILGFSRLLVRGPATVGGSIVCESAGDAFIDPDATVESGASISGCDHAP